MSDGGAEIITFWNLEEHSDEADGAAAVVDPSWLWLRGDGQRQVAEPYSGGSRVEIGFISKQLQLKTWCLLSNM